MSTESIDWAAIASVLGERSGSPIALLDNEARVRLFNRGMEQLLGWRRFEVEGMSWLELCIAREHRPEAQRWICEGLRGALRDYDAAVVTKTGVELQLHFELSLVGSRSQQGLLMTARRAEPLQLLDETLGNHDYRYEIDVSSSSFGTLRQISTDAGPVGLLEPDRPCYRRLHGLDKPCTDCPLRGSGVLSKSSSAIRRRPLRSDSGVEHVFEVITVEHLNAEAARLSVRALHESLLHQIHEHKLKRLTDEAGLTAREQEVLGGLLLGRSIDDIATMLDISTRTVKYHQANLLEKLGADSRVDLIRLVL